MSNDESKSHTVKRINIYVYDEDIELIKQMTDLLQRQLPGASSSQSATVRIAIHKLAVELGLIDDPTKKGRGK